MKTTEADFRFPVLGFTPDREIWGFQDLNRLTKCGPRTLGEGMQIGMELVDADGSRWMVRSARRTGRAGPLLFHLLPFLAAPQSRIEHELEPMASLSIDEIRGRVSAAMEAHAENYFESGEREAEFEPLVAKVKAARSVSEIYDILQPDTFEPY
jgi:hypothetical protein